MNRGELDPWLREVRGRIDEYLDRRLPPADAPPARLHGAMRHAVLGGGKRLRPALAFAAAQACSAPPEKALPVAAAVELVHAYSLVHDDLPAMDDDDERRGRPTVHVRFGEATAILSGDALLAAAFAELGFAGVPTDVVARLAEAAGSHALVGGQSDDLTLDPARATFESIRHIHLRKTCALFEFAAWGAGRLCGAPAAALEALERFGRHYGLAFQATDDLLDGEPAAAECSLALVLSPEEMRAVIEEDVAVAGASLADLGPAAVALRGLAESVAGRLT